jgi:hypothetical protein
LKTYAVRAARTKTTGHYRRPGTRDLYCGRPAGAPNDYARGMARFKMCTRCVKNEALDRAAATATAEAHLVTNPTEWERDLLASDAVRDAIAAEQAGTWRADWISSRATSPEPTLFDMAPDAEQGALFA